MTGVNPKRAVERCEQLAIIGPPPRWYRPILLLRWLRLYRAIMALDISQLAEMLREVYPASYVNELAARSHHAAQLAARKATT